MRSHHDVILRYSEGSSPEREGPPSSARSFGAPQDDKRADEPARRRWLSGVAIVLYFAILTIALFGDLLTSSRAVVSGVEMDVDQQFFAWRTFAFGELRHGRLPLWNPYNFGGAPALGNFQYAILYPPNWLHLVMPTGRAINVIAALHVFLAGVLAAAWCRSRRCSAMASMLGGTIFALGGPYILHLYAGHLTYLSVVAWTPLVFLAVDRIVAGHGTRSAWLLGALAVAMQVLGGYPQPAYYAGLAVMVYVAVRLLRAPWRVWATVAVSIAAMYLFGGMLAAAQLLPALDAARESVRADPLSYATAASYSLPYVNLLTLIAPYPFGDDFSVPYAGGWALWEMSLYVGPAALVLAVLGAMRSKRRADRAAAIVAVLAIVLALGAHTPLFTLLYHALPGFDRFRVPARFGVIASLMLAVLAAHGFDLMLRRRRRGTSRLAVAALVGAGWVLALALLVKARPEAWATVLENSSTLARSTGHAYGQFIRTAIVLAQVGIVLLLVRRVRWLGYAVALMVVADLMTSAGRAVERFKPLNPGTVMVTSSATRDWRTITTERGRANLATEAGFDDAWGYDPAVPARWGDFVGRLVGADPRKGEFAVQRVEPSPLWAMLRVGHSLPPGVTFDTPPLPRVLLVDEARIVDGPAASLEAVFDPSFDPRREVVLESTPSPMPSKGARGTASAVVVRPGLLKINAAVDRPAILLITDAYSAGWRARDGGYDVLPANHALRAIPLNVGIHTIVLEYASRPLTIGLWVSAIAWATFFFAGVVLTFRRLAARRAAP
jgi:hypothetical protein